MDCAQAALLSLLSYAEPVATEGLPAATSYGFALLKTLLALGLVCVAAYLLLRFGLRRLGAPALGRGRQLRLLERCDVGQGRSVCLFEADGRRFLVGASEGGVSLIAELMRDTNQTGGSASAFAEVLKDKELP